MQAFADHYGRCDGCKETWTKKNTLSFWYTKFFRWVKSKECSTLPNGLTNDYHDTIPPKAYYTCLFEWLKDKNGKGQEKSIQFTNTTNPQNRRIVGYKMSV